ncbi:isochorismatase family domain protein (plasmid) [Sinorhizobium sp. RAC02]|nr:isochorismatase family domain protein [Sinorhizobium sp. RAC02]
MQLVHDYPPAEFRNNVIALAKIGKIFNLPTLLTMSYAQEPNDLFLPEVVKCIRMRRSTTGPASHTSLGSVWTFKR